MKSTNSLRLFKRFDDEPLKFLDARKKCFEFCYSHIKEAADRLSISETTIIDVNMLVLQSILEFTQEWRQKRSEYQNDHFLMHHLVIAQHIGSFTRQEGRLEGVYKDTDPQLNTTLPLVCEVNPGDATDLSKLLKKVMEDLPRWLSVSSRYYSIKDLVRWYQEVTQGEGQTFDENWITPAVVIVLNDVDKMDVKVLYKWLYACSEQIKNLPIVNILKISEAKVEETFNTLLTRDLSTRIEIKHFSAHNPSNTSFYKLIDELFIKHNRNVPIHPSHHLLKFLIHSFKSKTSNFDSFLNQVRYMLLEHFNTEPLSLLGVAAYQYPNDSEEFGTILDAFDATSLLNTIKFEPDDDILTELDQARQLFPLHQLIVQLTELSYRMLVRNECISHTTPGDAQLRVDLHVELMNNSTQVVDDLLNKIKKCSKSILIELCTQWTNILVSQRDQFEKECEELEMILKSLGHDYQHPIKQQLVQNLQLLEKLDLEEEQDETFKNVQDGQPMTFEEQPPSETIVTPLPTETTTVIKKRRVLKKQIKNQQHEESSGNDTLPTTPPPQSSLAVNNHHEHLESIPSSTNVPITSSQQLQQNDNDNNEPINTQQSQPTSTTVIKKRKLKKIPMTNSNPISNQITSPPPPSSSTSLNQDDDRDLQMENGHLEISNPIPLPSTPTRENNTSSAPSTPRIVSNSPRVTPIRTKTQQSDSITPNLNSTPTKSSNLIQNSPSVDDHHQFTTPIKKPRKRKLIFSPSNSKNVKFVIRIKSTTINVVIVNPRINPFVIVEISFDVMMVW
ncbi:origin recognition complex subunit 3 [Acrasis kona]|uniref:Origin recognition complex subunit 3 n=1 Tax=Acrasis kona TaxID=1008807 RepID=A0AAW2Z9K6_9EUKA